MPVLPSLPRCSAFHWLPCFRVFLGLAAVVLLFLPGVPQAAVNIVSNSTTAQTLGPGQAGTIAARASLTVAGATPAVTIDGARATLSNFGTLSQTGTGNAIRADAKVTELVIQNGSATNAAALIDAAGGDVIFLSTKKSSVTLHNYGSIVSHHADARAIDFDALENANTINNHAGATISAVDGDAVRLGENGVIANAGKIVSVKQDGGGDGAIDGRKHSGIRITNADGGLIAGGGNAITGKQVDSTKAYTMTVVNAVGAVIQGNDGAGLNIDGAGAGQMVKVDNAGTITGNGVTGDGDGIDVDGMATIINSGSIRSFNAVDEGTAYSEAISIGGGTIVNSGTIEGLVQSGNPNVFGRAISLVGIDLKGVEKGLREGIYGDTRVENRAGGVIHGVTDSAIVVMGKPNDFTVTIDNQAGARIQGGSKTEAAVRSIANSTVITNAGTIDGAASNLAIVLGHANNTLIVKGGQAVIRGAIDGGPGGGNAMVVDVGAGNQFAYAGTIDRFDTLTVKSGHAQLSGRTSFTGKTIVQGGRLTLSGPAPAVPAGSLVLAGGVLDVAGAGNTGRAFAGLSLVENSTVDAGPVALSFTRVDQIVPGKTLTVHGTLRIAGDWRRDTAFQDLVRAIGIDDGAVSHAFDGSHTSIVPARGLAQNRVARADRPASADGHGDGH